MASQKTKPKPQGAAQETAAVRDRTELAYGPHRIIAGEMKSGCQAIAYLGQRRVDAASGETVQDAVAQLKAKLDERTALRQKDRQDGVPTTTEYREALVALPKTQSAAILPLLAAHGRMPDATAGLADIARRFSLEESTVTAAYNRLGRSVTALLGYAPSPDGFDKKHAAMASIAVAAPDADGKGLCLRLRSELVAALQPKPVQAAGGQ